MALQRPREGSVEVGGMATNMDEKEIQTLESEDEWDYENAERYPGVKNPGAVLAVTFSHDDFERLAGCAQKLGITISELVLEATLDRVDTLSASPTSKQTSMPVRTSA